MKNTWQVQRRHKVTNNQWRSKCSWCKKLIKYKSIYVWIYKPGWDAEYVCSYNCAELYIVRDLSL